jgi:hypothetical protein
VRFDPATEPRLAPCPDAADRRQHRGGVARAGPLDLDTGADASYDAAPILELERVTLTVQRPASADPIVATLGDPDRLAWMHANFTDHALVSELGQARSYASRRCDYATAGRDQVAWVIDRLRADPTSRSVTITTFEPLLDSTYIPCALTRWSRSPGGSSCRSAVAGSSLSRPRRKRDCPGGA